MIFTSLTKPFLQVIKSIECDCSRLVWTHHNATNKQLCSSLFRTCGKSLLFSHKWREKHHAMASVFTLPDPSNSSCQWAFSLNFSLELKNSTCVYDVSNARLLESHRARRMTWIGRPDCRRLMLLTFFICFVSATLTDLKSKDCDCLHLVWTQHYFLVGLSLTHIFLSCKAVKFNKFGSKDDGSGFKAALLSGPPGVGKTTTAALVCEVSSFLTFPWPLPKTSV